MGMKEFARNLLAPSVPVGENIPCMLFDLSSLAIRIKPFNGLGTAVLAGLIKLGELYCSSTWLLSAFKIRIGFWGSYGHCSDYSNSTDGSASVTELSILLLSMTVVLAPSGIKRDSGSILSSLILRDSVSVDLFCRCFVLISLPFFYSSLSDSESLNSASRKTRSFLAFKYVAETSSSIACWLVTVGYCMEAERLLKVISGLTRSLTFTISSSMGGWLCILVSTSLTRILRLLRQQQLMQQAKASTARMATASSWIFSICSSCICFWSILALQAPPKQILLSQSGAMLQHWPTCAICLSALYSTWTYGSAQQTP